MTTKDYKKAAEDLAIYAYCFRQARLGGELGRSMALVQLDLYFSKKADIRQNTVKLVMAIIQSAFAITEAMINVSQPKASDDTIVRNDYGYPIVQPFTRRP